MNKTTSFLATFTLLLSLLAFGGQAMAEQPPNAPAASAVININTATAAELTQLEGIGETKALAIVADRQANGPFNAPADLARVRGIGEATVSKNEGRITVQ